MYAGELPKPPPHFAVVSTEARLALWMHAIINFLF